VLGRDVTADDVEPINWAQAEQATTLTATDHAQALNARMRFRRAVHQWWADGFDLLLTPTTGEPPVTLGSFATSTADPTAPPRQTVAFTQPFNVTGQPAISLPLYWTRDGLPVGVQLVAASGREDVLIRVASQLEQARPWLDRRPPI
jgi:amidase